MEVLRIHEDIPLYYLTFSVIEWLPVFVSEEPCLIVTESLNFCHREKSLRTSIFCVMPTHVHLIVLDADLDTQRLRQTLMDMLSSLAGGLQTIASATCLPRSVKSCAARGEPIAPGSSGSRVVTRRPSIRRPFGKAKWITSTIIPGAKDWYGIRQIGVSLRRPTGCWIRPGNRTSY